MIRTKVDALAPLVILAFAACSDADKTIRSGSYDGFTIGSTGAQVYARVQEKFEAGGFNFFGLSSENFITPGYRTVAQAEAGHEAWKRWHVLTDSGLFIFSFENGILNVFPDSAWNPGTPMTNRVVFAKGMSYDSAFRNLEDLAEDTSFSSIQLGFSDKDFQKGYDPFMTDSRIYGKDDNAVVSWTLGYSGSAENSLELFFRDGKLYKMERVRRSIEFP